MNNCENFVIGKNEQMKIQNGGKTHGPLNNVANVKYVIGLSV